MNRLEKAFLAIVAAVLFCGQPGIGAAAESPLPEGAQCQLSSGFDGKAHAKVGEPAPGFILDAVVGK